MSSSLAWKIGSLSWRVRILVLLTISPAIVLVLFQASSYRTAAISKAQSLAMSTTRTLATDQQKLIDSTKVFLQKLAQAPMALNPGAPDCSRYLADVLSLNQNYVNLGLPQADGTLHCNALPLTREVNVADRPYFQQATQDRTFSVGSFQLDRAAQVASVNFAYPVIDPVNHEVTAVAVAVVSLNWWSQRLAESNLPEGAIARLSDNNGKVIARFPPEPSEIGALIADPVLKAALARPSPGGAIHQENVAGAPVLFVFQPLLEAAGVTVATTSLVIPLDKIYATANRRMWRDILFLLAGLLASGLLATLGVRRLVTQPLGRLLEATDQLANGQMAAEIEISGASELAELAKRFNGMAKKRQSIETQLRESEQNLSITLHSIGDAVIATDTSGRVTRMNPTAERLSGWTLGEAIGRPLADVFHILNATTGETVTDPVQLAMAHGQRTGLGHQAVLRARDGREYQIADSEAPICNAAGEIVGVVLVFSDVTEKCRIEHSLHESERALREAQGIAHLGGWRVDLSGGYVAWTDETFHIHELPVGEQPTVKQALSYYLPDSSQSIQQAVQESLETGQPIDLELQIKTAKGNIRWVHARGEALPKNDGAKVISGTLLDITERKRNETDLIAAKAKAERANLAKSRFLAAASHDLRQPLSALTLFVGVLKRMAPANCDLVVSRIEGCIDGLSELLTNLLDVSKLDARVVTPNVFDFSVDHLLATLVPPHLGEAEMKGLRLRVHRRSMFARTDPLLLKRILSNLIANAIRYTNQGGVLIACRRHQGRQWIEVWDTGIGIAADSTDVIFEEFKQLGDESRNRGSGLGLAIVAKTAALLGLEIRLESRPGRGSMFAIELPVGVASAPENPSPTLPAPKALRIALVDDNTLVLQAFTLALENEGHRVIAAPSGAALLEQLREHPPDMVISDYRLTSHETGFDVIESVRGIFGCTLPALLITGDTDPALVRSMADRGITVLYKPLQMEAVRTFIRDATERERPEVTPARKSKR